MTFEFLLQILWTGVAVASYVILFSMAFALILKVVKIWNFTQAGLMGVSFYTIYICLNYFALPLLPAVVIGYGVTVCAALLFNRWVIETLRARNSSSLTFFILTLVISQFMIYFFALCFGTEPLSLSKNIMSGVHLVGGIVISNWDLQAVGLTTGVLLVLYVFLNQTNMGQFMSAVADNASLAKLYGIDVSRVYIYTFCIAAFLMTVGMYLFGLKVSMIPETPLQMMLFAVIATLLGGIGNIFGAALAAVLLSLIQALSIFVIPSKWQSLILYVFLFVTILFFPQGFSIAKLKSLLQFKRT